MKKSLTALLTSLLLVPGLLVTQIHAEMTIHPFEPDDSNDMVIQPWYPNVKNSLGYNETDATGEQIFNAMLNQNSIEPEGFKNDSVTPYATEKDEEFAMLEKLEVFEYISKDETLKSQMFHDDLKSEYGINYVEQKGSSLNQSTIEYLDGLRYAQGVSFDPTGCGEKNYIAIIGAKLNSTTKKGSIYLYIIDADTEAVIRKDALVSDEKIVYDLMNKDQLQVVDSKNFFQITAGDYDGDGKDSLVVYNSFVRKMNSTDIYGLMEVNLSYSGWIYESGTKGKYLNNDYIKSSMVGNNKIRNNLCVSLSSGDINGDGIDDLAVLSYTGDIESTYVKSVKNKTAIPTLAVGYGEKKTTNTGLIVEDLKIDRTSIIQNINGTDITMAFPDVSIGDIDGDGVGEVVVAGYTNKTTESKPISVDDSKNSDVMAYAYYQSTGAGTLKSDGGIRRMSRSDISPIAKDDSLREGENLYQQYSVECVAVNGKGTKEYVFANGWFYFLDDSGKLASIATNTNKEHEYNCDSNPFLELTTKLYNEKDIDEVFIYSASVGNLFGIAGGNEAILMTIGYKTHTNETNQTSKEGKYHFQSWIFWQNDDISSLEANGCDGKGLKMNFKRFGQVSAMSRMTAPEGQVIGDGTAVVDGANGSPVALMIPVDIGNDTVITRYSGKAFAYTDPTVVAFLQAAPYYSELGAENSSTKYSYSESYRSTRGTGSEESFNVGITAELEAGPLRTELSMGCAFELNKDFTESVEKTFTGTFEANDQNQIILRQTLMYYYFYDVYSEGKWRTGGLVVSAPQYPVFTSVNMDQYNELAKTYNAKIDEKKSQLTGLDETHKLDIITDDLMNRYYLDNEGNPFRYASNGTVYGSTSQSGGWDLGTAQSGSSETWMNLSHAGGTQEQTYTTSLETEKTTTIAEGCYANLAILFGADGGLIPVSAYEGVTADYEYLSNSTISSAHITTEETSGAVQNLPNDQIYSYYGFDWKLIGWKTTDLFAGVPFVGYAVRNQRDLPKPADDLTAEYSSIDNKVTLKWTAPEVETGRMGISHFILFEDDNQLNNSVVNNLGAGKEHTFEINVSDYTKNSATYTVKSFYEKDLGNGITGYTGLPSNEAFCVFTMTSQEVNNLIANTKNDLQAKIDAINQQLAEYGTVTGEQITELIAAYQKADELLQGQIDDLETAHNELDEEMGKAIVSLNNSIDVLNADLTAQINALEQATDESLQQAIKKVTDDYAAADTLLKSELVAQSEELTALQQTTTAADAALQTAIDKVNADLTAAIEEVRNATDEAMDQAIADLSDAYTSADLLLKSDIASLQDKLASLQDLMKQSDELTGTTIEQVQDDLEEVRNELTDNMTTDFETINNRIDSISSTLDAASSMADSALQNNIDAANATVEEVVSVHKKDIELLQNELDILRQELKALQKQVETQDKTDTAHMEEIRSTQTITYVSLGVGTVSLAGNVALLLVVARKLSLFK